MSIVIIAMLCSDLSNSNAQEADSEVDVALCDDSRTVRALEDMKRITRGRGRALLTDAERLLLESRWISIETCSALTNATLPEDEYYVRRAQWVLGVLKDPDTATFLRCYWSRHSNCGLAAWISGWRSHSVYFAFHTDEWNAMSGHWSAHFQWLLRQRLDSDVRVEVQRAVDEWFFDEAMTKVLLEYRGRGDLSVEEQVVVEGALWKRGQLDQERLETAFDRLSRLNPKSFVFYAQEYPTPECVRPLIRLTTEGPELGTAAERLLQRITFQERPSDGWSQWFERNRATPRTAWLAEASNQAKKAIAEKNWPLVRSFINEHGLSNDVLFVEWLAQLASYPPLAEDIVSHLRASLHPRLSAAITPALAELRRHAEKDHRLRDVLRRRLLVPLSWEASLEELEMHGTP